LILQFPLTVRTFDKALAVMFAGPSEELFFRGLLLTPFIKWGKDDYKFEIANPISTKRKILSISIVEIFGITFSTLAFTFLHINYYGNPTLLLIVALSGIVLGLVYQKYQDLTANILAHFFLNLIVTIRIFGQLTF
jgi:membrane protease YdiL (CAAX protease family)